MRFNKGRLNISRFNLTTGAVRAAAGALEGSTSLTASAFRITDIESATFTGAAQVDAIAYRVTYTQGGMVLGLSEVEVSVEVIKYIAALLEGGGTLEAEIDGVASARVELTGQGQLNINMTVTTFGAAEVEGSGLMESNIERVPVIWLVGSELTGEATTTASSYVDRFAGAILAATGGVEGSGNRITYQTSQITGEGQINSSPIVVVIVASELDGEGSIDIEAIRSAVADINLTGSGLLSADGQVLLFIILPTRLISIDTRTSCSIEDTRTKAVII